MKKFEWSKLVIHAVLMVTSLLIIIPLLMVISASFTSQAALTAKGYRLIPSSFSLEAYKIVMKVPMIIVRSYEITIFVTMAGTLLGLLVTAMTGYVISRQDFKYNRFISFYAFFPMLFNGGMVPFYILMTRYLHLSDNILALILPGLLSPFYVIIMKSFMKKMSYEIIESAKIDGAGEWRIFLQMVLPLSTPALGTIGLFIAFGYWNDWLNGMLFINNDNWVPIQLLLIRMMKSIEFFTVNPEFTGRLTVDLSNFPTESVRNAMTVLAIGPMMFIFPFFQKSFVSGLTVGAIKG